MMAMLMSPEANKEEVNDQIMDELSPCLTQCTTLGRFLKKLMDKWPYHCLLLQY